MGFSPSINQFLSLDIPQYLLVAVYSSCIFGLFAGFITMTETQNLSVKETHQWKQR
jgi:hypothetical protein